MPWFDNVEHCYIKHDQHNFQHNIVYPSDSVCNRVPNLWLSNVNPDQPGFYVNIILDILHTHRLAHMRHLYLQHLHGPSYKLDREPSCIFHRRERLVS